MSLLPDTQMYPYVGALDPLHVRDGNNFMKLEDAPQRRSWMLAPLRKLRLWKKTRLRPGNPERTRAPAA